MDTGSFADVAVPANFAAFEVDEELLGNLREYALANSLYWALCEGHACEISARRNAMDVSCRRPLGLESLSAENPNAEN